MRGILRSMRCSYELGTATKLRRTLQLTSILSFSRPEKALKDVFKDDAVLFGHHTRESKLKVAVTATSCSGGRTILLSNYNAKDVPSPMAGRKDAAVPYLRFRPNSPRDEIRTWEA